MAMPIYEMKNIKAAWQGNCAGDGWSFFVETDAGQFCLATDHTYRCVTIGTLLMCHMDEPAVCGDESRYGKTGWEAWVFDRRLNAMAAREHDRMWQGKERKFGEEWPIPTDEEVDAIYERLHIPWAVTDVQSVFRECVEVGDDGEPITGIRLPINSFWRVGKFAPVSRERLALGDWDNGAKRFENDLNGR